MFPKLVSGDLMGVYFGKLKYNKFREHQIDNNCEAYIIPFAQGDVIATFMTGIDRELKEVILETIEEYKIDKCNNEECIEKLKQDVDNLIEQWSQEYL